jgi:predicted negative regulator of RcsB-dependent stress response
MGEVYEIKGDRNSAVQAYQSAVDNGSDDNSWKAAAQDRLNQLR